MILIERIKKGKQITTQELRLKLSKILKSRHTHFVTSYGKPSKVVIPHDIFFELLELCEKLYDATMIQELGQECEEIQ